MSTVYVTFTTPTPTNYPAGFAYSSGGGADMELDRAGNPHIVSTAGDIGHLGYLEYRRWTRASNLATTMPGTSTRR